MNKIQEKDTDSRRCTKRFSIVVFLIQRDRRGKLVRIACWFVIRNRDVLSTDQLIAFN